MPVIFVDDLDDTRLDPYRSLKSVNPTRWSGKFIAEGHRVVRRLIRSPYEVESILVSDRRRHLIERDVPPETDLLVLPQSLAAMLVGYNFHAGVMACGLRQPSLQWRSCLRTDAERLAIVVCPRMTDPDNLGSLIRLCTGFGVDALFLGDGCADPFSRRVLRVSMGNAFGLPIVETPNLLSELEQLKRERNLQSMAAVLSQDAVPLHEAPRIDRWALVLGNEADGLSEEWIDAADHLVSIPMRGETDSLNVTVAAGIMLYALLGGN